MRCPDCNKFASFDTEVDPEGDLEVSEEGMLSGDIRRVLNCADCSQELKEATLNFDQDLNDVLTLPIGATEEQEKCEHDWNWTGSTPSMNPTDRYDDKGGKIKQLRYMKHLYGVEVVGEVECTKCKVMGQYSCSQEEAAGAFDELV